MSSIHSPIFSRSTYQSSSAGPTGVHYFNNSPPHEMWSQATNNATLAAASDDYGGQKAGGLPGFQRISSANVNYSPTGRTTNHFSYGSQVSIALSISLRM